MKRLISAVFAAALLAAVPVHADDDDDDDYGHRWHKHKYSHGHYRPHWKHDKHIYNRYGPPRVVHHVYRHDPPRVVHHHYAPSYYAPAPGIHFVLPNIYIPFH